MTGIVHAEAVAYRYPQNNYGLAPVSLSVQPGERLLVAGPSGCGKSTLARCLAGLIPHLYRGLFAGDVWLDGLHTATARLWRLAERAGLVFQNPAAQMLGQSVEEEIVFGLENLGLPPPAIGESLESTLDRFGLRPLRRRSPQTLSGGEQQKLALAAIMARRPPVLILDEPLSMLDTTAAAELVAHLAGLADSGTALVICEHRREMVQAIPGLQVLSLPGHAQTQAPLQLPHLPAGLAPPPALQVSGLTVHLGGRPVLHDLTFSASGGQVLAVVGRNGVGKTTLLRALAGLRKHQGIVAVDGRPPDLGLVFQNADLQLFNATVRDEILYRVPDPDPALCAWLLEALSLARYEQVPPLPLSEGEKKRVALATVLMRQPRHGLLLDEPAVGQDASHRAMLIRDPTITYPDRCRRATAPGRRRAGRRRPAARLQQSGRRGGANRGPRRHPHPSGWQAGGQLYTRRPGAAEKGELCRARRGQNAGGLALSWPPWPAPWGTSKFLVEGAIAGLAGTPAGFVALELARSLIGYVIFGALGALLGGLTLAALRKAGLFAYLAEKKQAAPGD